MAGGSGSEGKSHTIRAPSSDVTAASSQTQQDEIKVWELMKCDGIPVKHDTKYVHFMDSHTHEAVMKGSKMVNVLATVLPIRTAWVCPGRVSMVSSSSRGVVVS